MKVFLWSTAFIRRSELPLNFKESDWFKRLQLVPKTHGSAKTNKRKFDPKPEVIDATVVDPQYVHVPRFFAMEWWAKDPSVRFVDKRLSGLPIDCDFEGTLQTNNPPQQRAADAALTQLRDIGGAMLVLACGCGKTVISLYIAHALGRKTIVLIRSQALLEQWMERIQQFLPSAEIGRIQQNVVDTEGKDIVLAMVQSIAKRDYPPQILEEFGLAILDEAHAMAAPFFQKCLFKLPAAYILGLTATPDRTDGLGYALPWLMGPIAFRAARDQEFEVTVQCIRYESDQLVAIKDRRGEPAMASMVNAIAANSNRTQCLLQHVHKLVFEHDANRQVLMLTDRREHVIELTKHIADRYGDDVAGAIMGGQRAAQRASALTKRVIVSTYHFFAEGQDVPRLDTLFLCTPRANVEQAVGRILRPCINKKPPLIIDFWDNYSIFPFMLRKRRQFYKNMGYTITCSHSTC